MKTKTILATVVAVILLFVAGAAAFMYSGIYNVSASSPHGDLTAWILETTMRNSVERRADQVQVPDLGDQSLVLAGINDFEEMCVQCHGAPGREPALVGKGLNPPPPDLAESATEMTAAELFWITKHGIKMTGMPAWGETHQDDALWSVVAFITELPELDAAAYDELLESAEGMGHHAEEQRAAATRKPTPLGRKRRSHIIMANRLAPKKSRNRARRTVCPFIRQSGPNSRSGVRSVALAAGSGQ